MLCVMIVMYMYSDADVCIELAVFKHLFKMCLFDSTSCKAQTIKTETQHRRKEMETGLTEGIETQAASCGRRIMCR